MVCRHVCIHVVILDSENGWDWGSRVRKYLSEKGMNKGIALDNFSDVSEVNRLKEGDELSGR